MSGHRARVYALTALVAGSPLPAAQSAVVQQELREVYEVRRVRNVARRLLLQILHSTRALDTSLAALIQAAGGPPSRSLGSALVYLETSGIHGNHLLPALRRRYQTNIVENRNKYMHEAGLFPVNTLEIATLLSEMQACLVDAYQLWRPRGGWHVQSDDRRSITPSDPAITGFPGCLPAVTRGSDRTAASYRRRE